MTRKFSKHLQVTYGTLNSCFNLIGSHQQCIPREIELATTECRAKTLSQGHRSLSHISDAILTCHGKVRYHLT